MRLSWICKEVWGQRQFPSSVEAKAGLTSVVTDQNTLCRHSWQLEVGAWTQCGGELRQPKCVSVLCLLFFFFVVVNVSQSTSESSLSLPTFCPCCSEFWGSATISALKEQCTISVTCVSRHKLICPGAVTLCTRWKIMFFNHKFATGVCV